MSNRHPDHVANLKIIQMSDAPNEVLPYDGSIAYVEDHMTQWIAFLPTLLATALLGSGNVYSTWFPTGTLWIGSVEIEFNAIKAVVYTIIALIAIVATKGRLGHRAGATGRAATHGLATVET